MYDLMSRINTIKAKIKCLEKIIQHDSWIGAGLTIGVNVGPLGEDCIYDVVAELGIVSQDQCALVLKALLQGLELSLAFNMDNLTRQYQEVGNFLGRL